ncbi:peptidylprolyl isomerase [Mycolicibacterium sp.]|uniref:peptidylprolyl isomerase n=1 Tax=Mycolicibacterium sp. TaxID=2320850 RepID=UPI0037C63852
MTLPPPPGGYLDQPGYPPPVSPRTNSLAIASLVCAFLFAPLGIVFGHMSLSQIKRSGEQGRGLAMAGLIIGYVLTVVTIIAVIVALVFSVIAVRYTIEELDDAMFPKSETSTATAAPTLPNPPTSGGALPAFRPPADLGANCQYPATHETAARPAAPPRTGQVPTDPATVSASVSTDRGNIGLQLANGRAPCTVNNFASLAQQGYFDGTPCHRLTTGSLSVLQCGDPAGTGTGGPGYSFADEYPVNQLDEQTLSNPVVYPRGTLAMANAGSDTNGSQFFMVYQDSLLPPTYTVFGTVDQTGLATLDKIAADGVEGGGADGKPATPVTITSARLD